MPSRSVRRVWQILALLPVVVVAAVNLARLTVNVLPPPGPGATPDMADLITRCERRFAGFREGAQRRGLTGRIGYVEDAPGTVLPPELADADYGPAQFALVPLVLDSQLEKHNWAMANFRATAPEKTIPQDWSIAEDFGAGVLLLRKSVP